MNFDVSHFESSGILSKEVTSFEEVPSIISGAGENGHPAVIVIIAAVIYTGGSEPFIEHGKF